ncbi:MAG: hypothetical protein K0Q78_377 [Cellvibrio sp.]|nr:hypothetical protein [Cellvibrio sp.]
MSNANLLNSLLGASGTNPAATKAATAKTRAQTNEKFQQALEQARPEVAARKPVARRESAASEASGAARSASKPIDRHNPKQETVRTDSRRDARPDEASTAGETRTESPDKGDLKTPADTAQKNARSVEEQTPNEQADLALATGDAPIDPALAMPDQSSALLVSPEDLFDPETNPPGLVDPTREDIAVHVDPDLNLVSPDANQSPLVSVVAGAPADALVGPLATINQAALGQVGSAVAINSPLTAAQPLTAVAGLTGALGGDVSDNLTLEPALSADTEGEPSADADNGENPDFLLLNSKAALNKLTDASTSAPAQDKAAVDLAKPTVIGAAVESLTRLTEAQSPAARAFVVQTGVPVTVGSPQWSQAVGDKVLWLAAQNVSAAEIRLDPPELGPMQVRVSINQDQASVTFTSPHPVVREALDQQLNRLREMFSEQGLNLVNVDVSDKSFAQQEREQQESGESQATADVDEEDLVPVGVSQAISMRLVDHYA